MNDTAYVVSAQLTTARFAVDMVSDDGSAKRLEMAKATARAYRANGWTEVKLSRVRGKEAIEKAECQIDRVEDWASDVDIWS